MKRGMLLALILITVLLIGCDRAAETEETEPVITYDWMAGESLIPEERTGIGRQGIAISSRFESTSDGVYFIYRSIDRTKGGTWILYGDNGSDTIIKLCSRPDCTHSGLGCDAYAVGAYTISYYDGYLYTTSGSPTAPKLVRMNLDGTDRVTVMDAFQKIVVNGYTGLASPQIWKGVYTFISTKVNENGETIGDCFYYKLDGTMEAPESVTSGVPWFNGDDLYLVYTNAQYGGEYGGLEAWDPETNTSTYLTDHSGQPGYYGAEEAYYFRDGTVWRLDYATQQESVLFETELEGNYKLNCYPDCIVIASRESGAEADRNLYIYNWAFELVDQIELDYPISLDTDSAIVGETAERIILTDCVTDLPRYYIEKSELGTGEVKIHEYKLPDMVDEIALTEELLADS